MSLQKWRPGYPRSGPQTLLWAVLCWNPFFGLGESVILLHFIWQKADVAAAVVPKAQQLIPKQFVPGCHNLL